MTDRDVPEIGEKSSSRNVTNIKDARQKQKQPTPCEKISQGLVCKLLAEAVAHSPASSLPDFPHRYRVLEPKPGVSIPLLVRADESVIVVCPKALANDILRYCTESLAYRTSFCIKPRLSQEAADYFLAVELPIDPKEIKLTRWADEPGLTYRRLPWKQETGPAPTWEVLLSRMSNAQAFIDWVGSLFFEGAYLHNYVWIHGEGGDGKGAINRFLGKVFDTAYRSKTAPTRDKNGTVDKFWAYNLMGARVAAFPDCEDATFITSGLFKSLTGGDPVEVEAKGQMGFTIHLQTRYLILANVKPAMTSAKSNIRRIIYCEMEPTEQDWTGIEDKLWEEGGYFLSQCIENYRIKYPNHGPLETDNSALLDVIDENEQHLENFFNEYFEVTDKDAYATGKEIKVAAEEVWPRSRKTYRDFLAWLKRAHGIDCVRSNAERRYYGMGRKRIPAAANGYSLPSWDQ